MPRLLIIDNNQELNQTLKDAFEENINYSEVLTASSAEEGLKLAYSRDIDTILLDLALQDGSDDLTSGLTLLAEFKNDPRTKLVPIIVITAPGAGTENKIRGLKKGADCYLSKPFDINELIAWVKAMLRIREAEKQLSFKNRELEEMLKKRTGQLQQTEEKYEALFDHAPMGMFCMRFDDGALLECNEMFLKILGYSHKDECQGIVNIFVDHFSEEDMNKFVDFVNKKRKVKNFQIQALRRDGEKIWLNISWIHFKEHSFIEGSFMDITEQKKTEEALIESQNKYKDQSEILEHKNLTLRELMGQIKMERKAVADKIILNVNRIILPGMKKLKTRLEGTNREYLELIEGNLREVTSPFVSKLSDYGLTPKEITVCDMIKNGYTSKDISDVLNSSKQTVDKHRYNIRKKLGLLNKRSNLTTFLHGF
jgi:PAS domain S-box-containing protein